MKKIALIILIAFVGCNEDTPPTKSNSNSNACNCGVVANDGIDGDCYWLEIRNDCSGNKKKFCFDQDVWMTGYVGSNFCVHNSGSW